MCLCLCVRAIGLLVTLGGGLAETSDEPTASTDTLVDLRHKRVIGKVDKQADRQPWSQRQTDNLKMAGKNAQSAGRTHGHVIFKFSPYEHTEARRNVHFSGTRKQGETFLP